MADELIYRTTNGVKCPWCGAEPGESCHLEPGRSRYRRGKEMFHIARVDPTGEPTGVLGPPRHDSAFREILPVPEGS